MSQRPTIKKPTPLSEPEFQQTADPVMGGINIPKFSSEMQAEVSPEAAPLWNFVTTHARQIAAAVVSIVVVITLVAGWQWYRETKLEEARSNLGRVISIQDPAKRVAGLEQFLSDAPSKLELSARLELAAACVAMKDWDKAVNAYQKIADMEGSTPLGFSASLNRAQLLMRKGDFTSARTEFQRLVQQAPAEVKPMLHQQAAEAAQSAGDIAGAIADYEAAVAALPPTDKDTSAFFRSRIANLKK